MIRYAVASNFETEQGSVVRRFFTGATGVSAHNSEPDSTANPDQALLVDKFAAADGTAVALTELSRTFLPREGRTWFVVEFVDAVKRNSPARILPRATLRAPGRRASSGALLSSAGRGR